MTDLAFFRARILRCINGVVLRRGSTVLSSGVQVLILTFIYPSLCLDVDFYLSFTLLQECASPMGMENRLLPDYAITASSEVRPANFRVW